MGATVRINKVVTSDTRFDLKDGAGSDAIHTTSVYAYAVCRLKTDNPLLEGVGLAFTLGIGNELICNAINYLKKYIQGKEINELMSRFGEVYKAMADDPDLRWLGPHKGVVHLALAAIVNACYDLWAKSKSLPLWKLLIELSPEELVNTLDFSYYEDVLPKAEAITLLKSQNPGKEARKKILNTGYPGYDTSVGWFKYSEEKIATNIKTALDKGFTALKLKVGSKNPERDIRRANLLREIAGDKTTIMFDANQQWNLPQAISMCKKLKELNPFWIEEPTHPDDIQAHVSLAEQVDIKLALGEHVPNKIMFKNFFQSGCMSYNQVDAVRVGGVSEFILISLLSKKYNIPVVPHVGDMGQIHQHMVLFNHITIGHSALFLEHIPHLRQYFKHPVSIIDGKYKVPQEPGMSSDLKTY